MESKINASLTSKLHEGKSNLIWVSKQTNRFQKERKDFESKIYLPTDRFKFDKVNSKKYN